MSSEKYKQEVPGLVNKLRNAPNAGAVSSLENGPARPWRKASRRPTSDEYGPIGPRGSMPGVKRDGSPKELNFD